MIRGVLSFFIVSTALISLPAFAQHTDTGAVGAPGCGAPTVKFAVKTAKGRHPAQPEAGKALVYFIEDDSNFSSFPKPTTRAGLNGKWVGATHGNSYLYFAVNPGVHHLCASWQTGVILGKGHMTGAAHFTADAGGVYYFEVQNKFFMADTQSMTDLTLTPLDSDEGEILVNKFALSTSHVK
jgi:hypothetical protein